MRHDCHISHHRKARKVHICEECRSRIEIGEQHSEKSGISDRTPYRTRMCQMCSTVHHVVWALWDGYEDDGPYIGTLVEWIRDNDDILPWCEPKGAKPYDTIKAAFDTIEKWRGGMDLDERIRQYRDARNEKSLGTIITKRGASTFIL